MKQSDHIDTLIKFSEEQSNKEEKIQKIYQQCIVCNNDEKFTELIIFIDSYCIAWIRKQLWKAGCYSVENEDTILQEARLAVWKSISDDKETERIRDSFAYYAFGIYKNKTLDSVRKIFRKKMNVCSIDEPIGNGDITIGDTLFSEHVDVEEFEERRQMYHELFKIYCISFLTLKTFPPRSLALYYARVLPHLLTAIPDTKATSAKWALEKMGNRTMWSLKEDSEATLKEEIDNSLKWCDDFIGQLNEKSDIGTKKVLLKNIVYTAVYDKGKIEDWADYMHKVTIKGATNLVLENPKLLSMVKEYVLPRDVLHLFMEGGGSR